MAVVFDAVASQTGASTNTISWSHAGAASPSNYLAVVGLSTGDGTSTVSSITYGGTNMNLIVSLQSGTGAEWSYLYGLINPPTGTRTVTVTLSASASMLSAGSLTFTGADQSTGWHNTTSATTFASSVSIDITSAVGEMTVTNLIKESGGIDATTNQTLRWSNAVGGGRGEGDTAPGAATVTHTWTLNGTTWAALVGASIIAAAATTTLPIFVQC